LVGVVLGPAGEGLKGVQILLGDSELVALSDEQGAFRVDGLAPGVYRLTFFKPGYEVHRYRYVFPDRLPAEIDLGAVVLNPLAEGLATVTGTVVDSATAEPVIAAQLMLDQETVGLTDASGNFVVEGVTPGLRILEVRRIGYQPVFVDLEVSAGNPHIDLLVKLTALPPYLEEVVVEAEASRYGTGKLRRFWRRQQSGVGHFITAADIEEREPLVPTDLLRDVPGLWVRRGPYGNNQVELARTVPGCSSPTYFLDGARVGDRDIDATFFFNDTATTEIYTRPSQVPSEFNTRGDPTCGVVAVWMR
jgi:hypothetical protein